ncbi:protein transporter Sec31 [Kitasatospora aureofaciens]|uniref:protein transporter Sec31 n=1 Tax=Kitasatospora aureofaciens TaxID=1894 RepID=UPI0038118767
MSLLMRNVTRTRLTPFAPHPGAPVELVEEEYVIPVPRDWDRAVLAGVAIGTGLLLALAVTWSTSSIGGLLALSGVWSAIAYGVAAVFDLAWILCMALEWLARFDPRKAAIPRRAGYAALGISMAAIAADGFRAGGKTGLAIGLIGAAVSLIAKGVWTLAIRHTAKPLSPIAQQYVARRQAAAGAELALAVVERQLERSRGHLNAYRQAYGTIPAETGQPYPDPDKPSGQPDSVSPTVRSAVRAAVAVSPEATPEDIVEQLARIGINTDANTVRTLSGQTVGQESDNQDSRSGAVLALAPHAPDDTITDTVRSAVRTHGDNLDAVLSAVRRVHGPNVQRETVRRLVSRVAG